MVVEIRLSTASIILPMACSLYYFPAGEYIAKDAYQFVIISSIISHFGDKCKTESLWLESFDQIILLWENCFSLFSFLQYSGTPSHYSQYILLPQKMSTISLRFMLFFFITQYCNKQLLFSVILQIKIIDIFKQIKES